MKFAERLTKSGFKLMDPEPHRHGDILLAERYANPTLHNGQFLIETLWAIRRDKEDTGRTVFHGITDPAIIRRAAAIADAKKWIEDNLNVGRYS